MRNTFHHSIVTLLVIGLVLLGLQSVSFATSAPVGQGSATTGDGMINVEMVKHDCIECETSMDCCNAPDCQTAPHCVSYTAIGRSTAGFSVQRGKGVQLGSPDVSLTSLLVPTIYRPPWA